MLENVTGIHHKFVITVPKCKLSLLQLLLLQFDKFHWYLYILLILSFFSIRDSEQYREIIFDGGTPFQKVISIYCNYYYYGFIYIAVLYLLLTIGFACLNLFQAQKIRNNTEEEPFGIPVTSTEPENNLGVKPIVYSKIGFLLEMDWYSCD